MERDLSIGLRPPRPPFFEVFQKNADTIRAVAADPESVELPASTLNTFAKAKALAASVEPVSAQPGDDVVIIPLGTSSAVPNKYRNGTYSVSLCEHPCANLTSLSVLDPDPDTTMGQSSS